MTGSSKPAAQPASRQLTVDAVFADEACNPDRRARAILYLRYRRGERESILALVPRTLIVQSEAFSDVIAEPGTEPSREKVGVVQTCGLSQKVFGRIQLDDDVEPHTPADLPDWEHEGAPIDPDIRVSEDVFVVNDHTVAENGEPTPLGYVVAANTEVSLLFEDKPVSSEETVEYVADHSVAGLLHVINRLLKNSFGACVDGNFRAIEDHFVGWYRQLFFLKIKQDHQKYAVEMGQSFFLRFSAGSGSEFLHRWTSRGP